MTYEGQGAAAGDQPSWDGSKTVFVGPGLELIEQKIIAANTAAVTFSGLAGETDEIYCLFYQFINNSGFVTDYMMEPNGITAAQTAKEIEWDAGVVVAVLAALTIAVGAIGGECAGDAVLHARRSVSAVTRNRFFRAVSYTDTTDFGRCGTGVWANTATTITSLDVTSSDPSGIGIGSTLSLYRVRQP